ncbi:hypothetical protein ACFPVS_09930 [Neisseria weixii]|uniref:hypothetical protein n=1 Tax=Neisseria weixii TaxID=1853276 RepID=UPI0036075AA7
MAESSFFFIWGNIYYIFNINYLFLILIFFLVTKKIKKINLEDVQIIAVKATNSAKSGVAIYKEKRKIFTALCFGR